VLDGYCAYHARREEIGGRYLPSLTAKEEGIQKESAERLADQGVLGEKREPDL